MFFTKKKYLSEDQIVEDLLRRIQSDRDAVKSWKNFQEIDIQAEHHYTGRWIRNTYDLWDKNNPYTKEGNAFVDADGIASHENHADQMSMRIMKTVWERLQNDN